MFSETDEPIGSGSISAALCLKFCSLMGFHYSFIISNISPEMKIVAGVHCCFKNAICSLGRPFLGLTKSSEVPSLSSSMDWMREMWTPISRWMPEHSMQVRIPRLVDSHLGSINTDNIRKCMMDIQNELDICLRSKPLWISNYLF